MLTLVLESLPLSADILRGRVVDAETKEPIPEATLQLVQSFEFASWVMSSTADSLGCFHMNLMGRGMLSASMLGYYSKQKVVLGFSESTKDTVDVGDIALKPSETLMKMLEVKGRAKRFTIKGDTIVFNPEAFHLEEGTRLDELIRQLPGVEVSEDGNMTWNGKPIRITMDGESIFGGDGIINQLPVEAVESIKAYNKASKFSERTGKDDGGEDMVLDLTIKPGFLDRWYGDVEGTYQTLKHYNADLRMNRLSKSDPAMISANANNMNNERHRTMRGGWSNWGNGYGQSQGASAGYQHNWREKEGSQEMKSSFSASGGLLHADDWRTSYEETLNLMEDAANKRIYTEDYKRNHKLNPYFNVDLSWDIDSLNTIYGDIDVDYKQTRANGNRDRRQDDILQQLTQSHNKGRETIISADAHWYHFVNHDNAFGADFTIRYNDSKNESWTEREISPNSNLSRNGEETPGLKEDSIAQLPSSMTGGVESGSISQHAHAPSHTLSIGGGAFYKRWLTKYWLLDTDYSFGYSRKQSQQEFESNGLADSSNSYRDHNHSTTNTLNLRSTIDLSSVKIMPELQTQWLHELQDYQRGRLDTVATRNRLLLRPQIRITWKVAKSIGLELKYSHSTTQPTLINTLAFRDMTDPLFINEGNPDLKNTHINNISLDFNTALTKQQLALSVTFAYTHRDRMTRDLLSYQPTTGIYTSRPENVPGGQTFTFRLNYDQALGDIVRLQNVFRLTVEESYAFLTQIITPTALETPAPTWGGRNSIPCVNRQTQVNPVENLTVSMDWTWIKVSVFGELNANRLRYTEAPEQNTTQWNNRFGVNAELTRGPFVVKTRFYDQSYSGYTIEAMNRNMLIWDASFSWKFLRNKAKLTLELDDILNKKDSKWYGQTAYQQTTSWHDFRHHYASLTFTYHLDAKVKE